MLVCWQSGVREVVRSYQLERHSAHRRLEAEVSNIEGSEQLHKTVTTLGPKTPEQRVTTPPFNRWGVGGPIPENGSRHVSGGLNPLNLLLK